MLKAIILDRDAQKIKNLRSTSERFLFKKTDTKKPIVHLLGKLRE